MRTTISFIGAGRLGSTLAAALSRCGANVTMVGSRRHDRAEALARTLPGCQAVEPLKAASAEVVFISVPDDEIHALVESLPWRRGQRVVHCSGAAELSILQHAEDEGALIGGFHPLQIFSAPEIDNDVLRGSSVAVEGVPVIANELIGFAESLGMRVVRVPPGSRALYHAGANFAASFLLSLLKEAVDLWALFGVDEVSALQALVPLATGTLNSTIRRGSVHAAVSGPISRGDVDVIRRHLLALKDQSLDSGAFYRQLAYRQISLVELTGRIGDEKILRMRELLRDDG